MRDPETVLAEKRRSESPFLCLNQARFGIAWGALGAAMAVRQAHTR